MSEQFVWNRHVLGFISATFEHPFERFFEQQKSTRSAHVERSIKQRKKHTIKTR